METWIKLTATASESLRDLANKACELAEALRALRVSRTGIEETPKEYLTRVYQERTAHEGSK